MGGALSFIKIITMKNITFESIFKETEGFTLSKLYHKVLITVDIASKMLKYNNRNRALKNQKIKEYSVLMQNGKWLHNGDSIRFDKNGNISDGQNRLYAVVKSSTPIISNVETGIDVEAFDTIDIGKRRTGADTVYMYGIRSSNIVAAAIKLIMNIEDGNIGLRVSYSNSQISDFILAKGEEEMEKLVHFSSLGKKYSKSLAGGVSAGTYCALLYLMNAKNPKANDFFEQLYNLTTIGIGKGNPIRTLYDKLFTRSSESRTMRNEYKTVFIIKAYNAWVKDKKLQVLLWNPQKEGIPKIL